MSSKSINSPRLKRLQKELESGNSNALDEFWEEVAVQSAPLIEPIEGNEDDVFVTFLWQAKEELKNVVVASFFGGFDFEEKQMTRLLNTNLWYKSYQLRNDVRTTYRLSPNDSLIPIVEAKDWQERTATWQPDPLNPHNFVFPKDDEDPDDKEVKVSVLALPAAVEQPWVTHRSNVPKGQIEMHRLKSNILENERRVWVYTPPGYTSTDEPYGFLLLFDGLAYTEIVPTPTILDNLLADDLIPPLVAIMPNSLDQETRTRELPCYPPFVDFLVQELLPWARQRYHINSNPSQAIVAGSSYGGLASAFVGLKHSEIFGNVLSQSGSFQWKPNDEDDYEWLVRQFALTEKLPLNFYLDAGLLETISPSDESPSILAANRHMRDVLQTKGYKLHYAEFSGGHDYICWQGTLVDGLLALVGKN